MKHMKNIFAAVAVLAFNTPEMFEAHFSIPMTGAVLNTINTRLDYETIAYILDFGKVKERNERVIR